MSPSKNNSPTNPTGSTPEPILNPPKQFDSKVALSQRKSSFERYMEETMVKANKFQQVKRFKKTPFSRTSHQNTARGDNIQPSDRYHHSSSLPHHIIDSVHQVISKKLVKPENHLRRNCD
jgi:hypothetical protein